MVKEVAPMRDLDTLVASALYRAHLMERALHDEGPWTIDLGSMTEPAEREVRKDGVLFSAEFPAVCWLARPTSLVLRCRGEIVSMKPVDEVGDAAFAVTWGLAASQVGAVG